MRDESRSLLQTVVLRYRGHYPVGRIENAERDDVGRRALVRSNKGDRRRGVALGLQRSPNRSIERIFALFGRTLGFRRTARAVRTAAGK